MKFLSRREEIYDYWQGIHENEFADLQSAVKDFTEGLEGFDSENERLNDLIKKIQDYAKEFDQFPHSMQYTFQMKPFKMQDHVNYEVIRTGSEFDTIKYFNMFDLSDDLELKVLKDI